MPDNNYEKAFDIIFGRWKSQILYTGVRLGIFDCATSDAKTTSNIADELDGKLAYRLLRISQSKEGLAQVMYNHTQVTGSELIKSPAVDGNTGQVITILSTLQY